MQPDLSLTQPVWPRTKARKRRVPRAEALTSTLALLALAFLTGPAQSQDRPVPDTYTATTTNMTPAGVELKIDVLEWSDASARAAALSRLTADPAEALTDLPTKGYVWTDGSAVGYAVKYAHRLAMADGRERITIVTDKGIGTYAYRPWKAADSEPDAAGFSVIELYLGADGTGSGTLSLAAEVALDSEANTVTLAGDGTGTKVLAEAKQAPKPYWARGG